MRDVTGATVKMRWEALEAYVERNSIAECFLRFLACLFDGFTTCVSQSPTRRSTLSDAVHHGAAASGTIMVNKFRACYAPS